MTPSAHDHEILLATVARLELGQRRLKRTFGIGAIVVCGLAVAGFRGARDATTQAELRAALLGPDSVLRLRGLQIVDERGVARVRLGAPLPNPIVGGKESRRVAPVSGMLIADSDGDERGGFATADVAGDKTEAFIGLDSKEGQVTLFLANPHDGGNLQVWDQHGNRVGLFAVGGVPRIIIQKEGKTVTRLPADTGNATPKPPAGR